jgi:hypothetical protein
MMFRLVDGGRLIGLGLGRVFMSNASSLVKIHEHHARGVFSQATRSI